MATRYQEWEGLEPGPVVDSKWNPDTGEWEVGINRCDDCGDMYKDEELVGGRCKPCRRGW